MTDNGNNYSNEETISPPQNNASARVDYEVDAAFRRYALAFATPTSTHQALVNGFMKSDALKEIEARHGAHVRTLAEITIPEEMTWDLSKRGIN